MPMPGECFHVCAHGLPSGPVALHLCQRQESFTRPCVFTSCTTPRRAAGGGGRMPRHGGAHRWVCVRCGVVERTGGYA